ncbi:MAG: YIP1 family protein [Pseudanabaenaceae cyanobacterium bins.39]|nr:YIP1 family protein [Pseudanabaenaceae cyanobacterium bins.39]
MEEVTPPAQPQHTLGDFCDRLYGVLFLPNHTFTQIKTNPSLWQGVCVVGLVNILETLRLDLLSPLRIIWAVISGVLGWLFFTFLLKQLASVFGKDVSLRQLLCLTGFASLPWIFVAPALSLPDRFRFFAAIAAIIWFIAWQVWSAAIALDIKRRKTLIIIPLAIAGGLVALIWLGNAITLVISIT